MPSVHDSPESRARKCLERRGTLQVVFLPRDLTSDIGMSPLRIRIEHDDVLKADSVATQVSTLIHLRTFPLSAEVAISTSVVPSGKDAGVQSPDARAAYVDVKPAAALAAGWYVLSIDAVPPNVQTSDENAMRAGGRALVRFAVGSAPVVRSVSLMEKGGTSGSPRVKVETSEGVQSDPKVVSTALAVMDASLAGCTLATGGQPAPFVTRFYFDCPGTNAWTTKKVNLRVSPGLASGGAKNLGFFQATAAGPADVVAARSEPVLLDFSSLADVSGGRLLMMGR